MLIPFDRLLRKYDLKVRGVLHVGAHHAEELEVYEAAGVPQVVWVEGDLDSVIVVQRKTSGMTHHKVLRGYVDETPGEQTVYLANNGESSSLLEMGTHTQHHPEVVVVDEQVVRTTTIDHLYERNRLFNLNFWNLDIQGAELRALKGATTALVDVDYIYTEVNAEEVYVGCALVDQLDEFLDAFKRVETEWTPFKWGDAFYVRRNLL